MSSTVVIPSPYTTGGVVSSAVFPVLSLISIFLRFKARNFGRQPLLADDWWILMTWVCTLALSIIVWVYSALCGINTVKGDSEASSAAALIAGTQGLWIQAFLLQICISLVKISILCFYKRIFVIRKFRMVANFGIGVIAVWCIIYVFIIIFEWTPVSGAWNGLGTANIDIAPFNLSQAGTSIVLDLIVLCFPLPVISRLHMKTSRKVAVSMIFWLGGFCCIAAMIRLIFLVQGQNAGANAASGGAFAEIADDAKSAVFITIEPNCSIIAACLPCYGPLFEGGRAPESIIRSVRSALSLDSRNRSNGSGNDGSGGSRASRASRAVARGTPNPPAGGAAQAKYPGGVSAGSRSSNDSQIELADVGRDWTDAQSQGRNVTDVRPVPHQVLVGGERDGLEQEQGIKVARTYETSRV